LIDQAAAFAFWDSLKAQMLPALANSPAKITDHDLSVIYNAIVESSLLSLRVMNELFRPNPTMPDDMRSEQYPGFSGNAPFLTRDESDEIHKYLAHLTVIRAIKKPRGWKIEWFTRAFGAADRFLEYVESRPEFVPTGKDVKGSRKLCRIMIEAL
jgi:hypothetical protein